MAEITPDFRNIQIIPNGVDFIHFIPMDKDKALSLFDLPRDKSIVLFACDPHNPKKNITLPKRAFDIIDKQSPGKYYFWNAQVISHEKMPYVLNAADVLMFTSLLEGSPNFIKESMAFNLPIVSVPVGDVPEIIQGAKNCYIVNYDPIVIAENLHKVLTSGSRSNGREKIESLRLELVALKIESVYKSIL